MWWLFIFSLLWIFVSSECKYIRTNNNKAYELDTCSFSSIDLFGNERSWGIYCELDIEKESMIAVYKSWNTINCPNKTNVTTQTIANINCNGIEGEEDCDCIGIDIDGEDACSIATLRTENCDNTNAYEETKYIHNLCQISGQKTSKQIVCENINNENNLITRSYENTECNGHGFKINDGFTIEINNQSDFCAQIVCKSQANMLSLLATMCIIITTLYCL
eukprot:500692_1